MEELDLDIDRETVRQTLKEPRVKPEGKKSSVCLEAELDESQSLLRGLPRYAWYFWWPDAYHPPMVYTIAITNKGKASGVPVYYGRVVRSRLVSKSSYWKSAAGVKPVWATGNIETFETDGLCFHIQAVIDQYRQRAEAIKAILSIEMVRLVKAIAEFSGRAQDLHERFEAVLPSDYNVFYELEKEIPSCPVKITSNLKARSKKLAVAGSTASRLIRRVKKSSPNSTGG